MSNALVSSTSFEILAFSKDKKTVGDQKHNIFERPNSNYRGSDEPDEQLSLVHPSSFDDCNCQFSNGDHV